MLIKIFMQVRKEQTLTTTVGIGNLHLHDELQAIIDSIQAGRYSEQIVFPCSGRAMSRRQVSDALNPAAILHRRPAECPTPPPLAAARIGGEALRRERTGALRSCMQQRSVSRERESGRCNEVFPRETVGVLRSRLPTTAKCFPGRGSGRCVHAGSSEMFPKERVEGLRPRLQHNVFYKSGGWFIGQVSSQSSFHSQLKQTYFWTKYLVASRCVEGGSGRSCIVGLVLLSSFSCIGCVPRFEFWDFNFLAEAFRGLTVRHAKVAADSHQWFSSQIDTRKLTLLEFGAFD